MIVSTVTFDRTDAPYDPEAAEIDGLHGAVMDAFNRRFSGFEQGAGAQEAYRHVRADVEADTTLSLFGVLEAFRAALAAHPDAREWEAFEHEAAAAIAPFCFSMRFHGD